MITDNKQETYEETNEPLPQNCYNRLEDEWAIKFDIELGKYPEPMSELKRLLIDTDFWTELKFGHILDLCTYLSIDNPRSIAGIFKPYKN